MSESAGDRLVRAVHLARRHRAGMAQLADEGCGLRDAFALYCPDALKRSGTRVEREADCLSALWLKYCAGEIRVTGKFALDAERVLLPRDVIFHFSKCNVLMDTLESSDGKTCVYGVRIAPVVAAEMARTEQVSQQPRIEQPATASGAHWRYVNCSPVPKTRKSAKYTDWRTVHEHLVAYCWRRGAIPNAKQVLEARLLLLVKEHGLAKKGSEPDNWDILKDLERNAPMLLAHYCKRQVAQPHDCAADTIFTQRAILEGLILDVRDAPGPRQIGAAPLAQAVLKVSRSVAPEVAGLDDFATTDACSIWVENMLPTLWRELTG